MIWFEPSHYSSLWGTNLERHSEALLETGGGEIEEKRRDKKYNLHIDDSSNVMCVQLCNKLVFLVLDRTFMSPEDNNDVSLWEK